MRNGSGGGGGGGGGGRRAGPDALLLLGVVFHAVYVLSIFDIYFKSPVVAHVESVQYTSSSSSSSVSATDSLLLAPPAKRVFVFVADGCRADKFFESNASSSNSRTGGERVTFLRRMAETRGSWGVSHTRVPTESRPGHVALFAGMYEDVSAVTKGWQDNPVDFDSVFNQSRAAWLFGSPDIVPMFARAVPHAEARHYSHADEDFAKDASALDVWVFQQVAALFAQAASDAALARRLRDEQLVFFCHFLGIDSNGHAHRPGSRDYLNNIALVDELVAKLHALVEAFYGHDGRTAYVFSADHGMSNKGAHGDGDPANTRTPLVAWGAGVHGPELAATHRDSDDSDSAFHIDLPTQSRADVRAQLAAQQSQEAAAARDWGRLVQLTRKDVMQADVAPLVSALLGLPYPRNSVGVLPFAFLAPGRYRAGAVLSNARQLYQHARRKEQEKQARTLLFFRPLRAFRDRLPVVTQQLDALWRAQDYAAVERASQEMAAICLDTLAYFQRYDWFFLLSVIVLGYVGWVVVVAVAFLHPARFRVALLAQPDDALLWFLLAAASAFLLLESSPLTYFVYLAFPIVFWNFAWRHRDLLRLPETTARSSRSRSNSRWRRGLEVAFVLLCLELVVLGFERRFIFGVVFTLLGLWPLVDNPLPSSERGPALDARDKRTLAAWTASCLFISVFPYLSTEYGEHTLLVVAGGLVVLALALAAVVSLSSSETASSSATTASRSSNTTWLAAFAVVVGSLVAVQWTMWYLESKRKPPVALTLANWGLAIAPIAALLLRLSATPTTTSSSGDQGLEASRGAAVSSATDRKLRGLALRIVEIVLAFSPSYILLSISYEVFFYAALCCVLASWVALEARLSAAALALSPSSPSSTRWHEVRRAFFFLLLIKIAFFGTGNVASMSSFELTSTYRFVTVFSPFLMGALLVVKLLIPFMVVACAFHVVLEVSQPSDNRPDSTDDTADSTTSAIAAAGRRHPPSRYFLLVVGMSDVLALHFLFLVKNEGSWKEIGNSISMFGIANALIVFVPLLFMLAKLFVRDLLAPDAAATGESDRTRKTQ
ncbi:hypothetical protein PybrP1_010764 [[Pythium] brassicae (nom. inval.)]|nr:hypothetical protein PybrP1_010764 [[Pythium] brassicae (nom. inval.)]